MSGLRVRRSDSPLPCALESQHRPPVRCRDIVLLTQPPLGPIKGFAIVTEIGGGPAILGMLPEGVAIVVLLVNRQSQRQVAVQLVEDLPFETRKGQLMCPRFRDHTNEGFFHRKLRRLCGSVSLSRPTLA